MFEKISACRDAQLLCYAAFTDSYLNNTPFSQAFHTVCCTSYIQNTLIFPLLIAEKLSSREWVVPCLDCWIISTSWQSLSMMVLLGNVLPKVLFWRYGPLMMVLFRKEVGPLGAGAQLDEVGCWGVSLKGILTLLYLSFYFPGCHKVSNFPPTHPSTMEFSLSMTWNHQKQLNVVRNPETMGHGETSLLWNSSLWVLVTERKYMTDIKPSKILLSE